MPISQARPIDEIYGDVADHDLVLVPDAPLASALNRRLDRPHLGTFATTPRRLAAGRREEAEDRLAFLELIEQTDLDWKTAAHTVGNILQCWEHQTSIDAILEYEGYADSATEEAVSYLADLQTTSRKLTEYTIDSETALAVVAPEEFTPLERTILPEEYTTVERFTADAFEIPPFHVFDSSAALVDALIEAIDGDAAGRIAVVLDESSQYSSLVESALESADIPFYGGPGFGDDPAHRAFVGVLRLGQAGQNTTVEDVRPLCAQLGIDVPVEHDRKRLRDLDVDIPELDWLREFADSLQTQTFGEALTAVEARLETDLSAFETELDRLGLTDKAVTGDRVDDLHFYLQTYEVPVDRENEGVLLADAKAAGHVDRPLVFYLGLDESWTHSAPRRPWVDRDTQFERYLSGFQRLLQNGVKRYYLVQDTTGGEPVTPCLYFHELLEDVDRFSDFESVDHTRTFDGKSDGFEREPTAVEPEAVDRLSQSTLNSLVNCPRDQLFSRLVDSPDRDYFTEGTLFHDFAEVYATHPGAIGVEEIDDLVAYMLDTIQPYYPDKDRELRATKYRTGLETIAAYLDANPPETETVLTPTSGWGENAIATRLDVSVHSPITERWFENDDLGIKGMIDLVSSPRHLLDYKSGSKKSERDVVKQAATDPPADTPNYQALLYLAHWRSTQPGEQLEFTFFHFLDALDALVTGEASLDAMLTTVTYHPVPFEEYAASRDAYEVLLDGYNDCVETFEALGFGAYRDIMHQHSFPETTEKEELRNSDFATAFEAAVDAAVSDSVSDPPKGCDQAIREFNGVRKRAFFQEDLDQFEAFVREQRETLNRYRRGEARFPIEGPGGEPNYRRVDHRDMLLEGEDV